MLTAGPTYPGGPRAPGAPTVPWLPALPSLPAGPWGPAGPWKGDNHMTQSHICTFWKGILVQMTATGASESEMNESIASLPWWLNFCCSTHDDCPPSWNTDENKIPTGKRLLSILAFHSLWVQKVQKVQRVHCHRRLPDRRQSVSLKDVVAVSKTFSVCSVCITMLLQKPIL